MKLTKKRPHAYHYSAVALLLLVLILAACTGSGSGTVTINNSGSPTPAATATTASATPTATATTTPEPTVPLTSIRMLNQTAGWALTKNAILKTADGGHTWLDVTPANAPLNAQSSGDFMDGNYAWVATLQGSTVTILRTSDGGVHWQSATFTTQQRGLDRPHFINTQDGWIATLTPQGMFHTDEEIYQTTDGGQSWTMVATTANAASGLPAAGNKTGISFMNTTTGWATADIPADYSWLYKTTDGGKTWHNQPLPVPSGMSSVGEFITTPPVFFGSTGIMPVLLFVQHGGIDLYVTNNGGQSWTPTQYTGINSQNVYVVDPQHAWATTTTASNATVVYATSNGGKSWQQLSTLPQPVGTLSFIDDLHGWAIGTNTSSTPLLWSTSDSGQSWQSITYQIVH